MGDLEREIPASEWWATLQALSKAGFTRDDLRRLRGDNDLLVRCLELSRGPAQTTMSISNSCPPGFTNRELLQKLWVNLVDDQRLTPVLGLMDQELDDEIQLDFNPMGGYLISFSEHIGTTEVLEYMDEERLRAPSLSEFLLLVNARVWLHRPLVFLGYEDNPLVASLSDGIDRDELSLSVVSILHQGWSPAVRFPAFPKQ